MDRLVVGNTQIVPASRRLRVTYGGAVLETTGGPDGLVCFLERDMVEAIQDHWSTHKPVIDANGMLVLELAEEAT